MPGKNFTVDFRDKTEDDMVEDVCINGQSIIEDNPYSYGEDCNVHAQHNEAKITLLTDGGNYGITLSASCCSSQQEAEEIATIVAMEQCLLR